MIDEADAFEEGVKHYESENYAESIISFRKATEDLFTTWVSWVYLSLACVKQAIIDNSDSLFSEAFMSAQRGIKIIFETRNISDEDPGPLEGIEKRWYAAANYVLGICYMKYFGDLASAKRQYDLLMQIDPQYAEKLREIIFG